VPLHDRDGRAAGALAVLDTDIRNWADDQVRTLREIAEVLQVRAADPAAPPAESLLDAAGGDARFLTALLGARCSTPTATRSTGPGRHCSGPGGASG